MCKNKTIAMFAVLLMAIFSVSMTVAPAYASGPTVPPATAGGGTAPGATGGNAGATIETGVKTGLKEVYAVITAIVVPVAAVCCGLAVFKIFGGGERGMEEAKRIIMYTLAGIAIVYLAPIVVKQAASWFSGIGDGGIFS